MVVQFFAVQPSEAEKSWFFIRVFIYFCQIPQKFTRGRELFVFLYEKDCIVDNILEKMREKGYYLLKKIALLFMQSLLKEVFMKRGLTLLLSLMCVATMTVAGGCNSVTDGLNAIATNTTVDEAMQDLADVNGAIARANIMLQTGDDSVYGELVLSGAISFEDVVEKNKLDEQVETKRIDGVSYDLYWDNLTNYPFWSTDGSDDIRNSQEGTIEIKHRDSVQIKDKMNITELK